MEIPLNIQWIPAEKLQIILPLVNMLNDGRIAMEILENRLAEMIPMGYKCFGVFDQEKLIGVCGVWILNKLYAGKHVEPDNVIIHPEYQGKGVGNLMMEFLFTYAKEIGCERTEVNCYMKNERGKKFWESHGYVTLGYHLIKKFENE